ncbi:MAG TPA: aminotransferase class I/II-fold pyridoxal phosphate-dependent enzyme [Candidatus Cybelea sp.]|jgi:aromatic-L-amino-acid decarboxylase|nr:aminotransferase class I/II-fold pyridoxal phosphate-dependent enzyme [Candidatus Cybelea sp.]
MNEKMPLREAFGRVGAWIEEYFEHPEAYRVMPQVRPGDVAASLPRKAPESGEPFDAIFDDFERIVVPATTHWNHPRFFAYFATSAAPAAIAAEALAATLDVKAMLWRTSPAATELEEVTMRWLGQLLGLPAEWTGIIYDTASIAGFTALAAARESLDPTIRENGMAGRALPALRVYVTQETHSHVEKAAIALGVGRRNVVRVASDEQFRMRPDALRDAIDADRCAGMTPMAIVATVGTTSTTSVDPVREIAAVAREYGVWLHVDAAYAGIAAIVPEFRELLDGVELADSVVVNPHKWMFVPMDLSVLFVKDESVIRRAFTLVPEYLTTPETDAINYMDYGLQLGRRFRALKLWFVLRNLGAEGIRQKLRGHIALAQEFAAWLRAEPHWEILAPHPLSVVCFRYAPPGHDESALESLNASIVNAVNSTGELFISHTKIDGRYAIRLAIGNLRTQPSDVDEAWKVLKRTAQQVCAG